MAQRQISSERKGVFYVGLILSGIGLLIFLSSFLVIISNFGHPSFEEMQSRGRSFATRGVVGFFLILAGGFLTRLGRAGLAGSGLKLDPEAARRDVEPWSRMTGGVVKDALDEAGISLGSSTDDTKLPFDERLRRLQKLRDDGLVNESEFQAARRKILDGV